MGEPYDPRSGRGVIGRNYAYQIEPPRRRGSSRTRTSTRSWASGANGVVVDDFDADNFDHADLDFIGGGALIAGSTGIRPILGLQVPPGVPTWGARWKRAIREHYRGTLSILIQGQSPAYRTHFLDLDPTYRDAFGVPLLRMTFDLQRNERHMAAYLSAKATEIIRAMNPDAVTAGGSLEPHYDVTRYQTTHNTGGVIMGSSPEDSAVNTLPAAVGLRQRVRARRLVVSAERRAQPDGHGGRARISHREAIVKRYRKRPGSLV